MEDCVVFGANLSGVRARSAWIIQSSVMDSRLSGAYTYGSTVRDCKAVDTYLLNSTVTESVIEASNVQCSVVYEAEAADVFLSAVRAGRQRIRNLTLIGEHVTGMDLESVPRLRIGKHDANASPTRSGGVYVGCRWVRAEAIRRKPRLLAGICGVESDETVASLAEVLLGWTTKLQEAGTTAFPTGGFPSSGLYVRKRIL